MPCNDQFSEYERVKNVLVEEATQNESTNARKIARLAGELECATNSHVTDEAIKQKEELVVKLTRARNNTKRVYEQTKDLHAHAVTNQSELEASVNELKHKLDEADAMWTRAKNTLQAEQRTLFMRERRATRLEAERDKRAHERYKILRDAKLERIPLPVLTGSLTQLEVVDNDLRMLFLSFNCLF